MKKRSIYISTIIAFILVFLFLLFCRSFDTGFCDEKKKSITGNLKICFVIDTSDSMNKDRRFIRVKKALNAFVDSLIENDYFIVVTFDTRAYLKYSGIVGDEKVRKAIKRVFDSNYPDDERVKGMASQIILGCEEGFEEIEKTPQYQSTAVVFFTDGDHNPKPTDERWNSLCNKYKKWKNEPGFAKYRSLYMVDVGDPKHSKIMAQDLGIEDENYFPYSEDTDFGKILEKIRAKIPYTYNVRVFPAKISLGSFEDPGQAASNKLIILSNADFINKGGSVIPKVKFHHNGKVVENPGVSLNIPGKIDKEFFSEDLKVSYGDKKPKPGTYRAVLTFEPGGDLNARLNLKDERGEPVESAAVSFEVLSGMEKYTPLIWAGAGFIALLALVFIIMAAQVKKMPVVKGELVYKDAQNCDVSPQEADLFQPRKVFIFNSGKSAVTVGSRADVRLNGIPFLEGEHFQIEAETNYRYKVRGLDGPIELLDSRDNPRGSGGNIKHEYVIRIINRDNPEEWVSFRFDNRYVD